MEVQKIKVLNELRLSDIIFDIERGKLKIPRFQRDFIWERTKVLKLLDSIYNEFPIGSFFFWKADRKYANFFRNIAELDLPKPDRSESLDFILDGQQRITSLYVTIKGKKIGIANYGAICFNLEDKKFVLGSDKYKAGGASVPLCEILGSNRHEIYDNLPSEYKGSFDKCLRTFENYPLSIIVVKEKELDDAIEIFERINQGGKRLSVFDLVVASTWGEDFDLRKKYVELEKYLHEKGFGWITPEVILHTVGLCTRGYCRKIYLLQLTKEEISENWDRIENSIKLAVDYMSENLGVKIFDFLPYPAMLSLLSYLFFKTPKRSLDNRVSTQVNQWFWQAALSDRYTTSRETTMENDRRKLFDKLIEGVDAKIKYPISITKERLLEIKIGNKSSFRNAFFCLLSLRGPRHFKNNNPIVLDYSFCSKYNSKENHHIFPKAYLKEAGVRGMNLLLNFCFIPAELNKEITNKKPSDYFAEFFEENPEFDEALEAQIIPYGDFIKTNSYPDFLSARANKIIESFEQITGSKIIQTLSGNKNKAIDKIEARVRDFIDDALVKKAGADYWKKIIPSDIQTSVKERLDDHLKKYPDTELGDLVDKRRVDFCDMMDYCKIISKNWDIFGEKFKSKYELEKKFLNLKEFRNAVKHNREIDPIVRKEGEAAVEWFDRVIK
jgi:hypothetical protein